MSATRIVGIVCAAFPLVRSFFQTRKRAAYLSQSRWFRAEKPAIVMTLLASFGAVGFFTYSQLRWGHWDIYMLTQAAAGESFPIIWRCLSPLVIAGFVPALNDPTEGEPNVDDVGRVLFVTVAICELSIRRWGGFTIRAGIYFCAFVIFISPLAESPAWIWKACCATNFAQTRANRAGAFEFFESISRAAALVRAFGTGGSGANRRRRAMRAGVVRLEFHPGTLGRVEEDENKSGHYWSGPGGFNGRLSSYQRRRSLSLS
jgi:hypothetical protein